MKTTENILKKRQGRMVEITPEESTKRCEALRNAYIFLEQKPLPEIGDWKSKNAKTSDKQWSGPLAKSIKDHTGGGVHESTLYNFARVMLSQRERNFEAKTLNIFDKYIKLADPEEGLEAYRDKLKILYDQFKLSSGCDLSDKALRDYPDDIDIIRWWTLFHNRAMEWRKVRKTLEEKLTIINKEAIKAICYLGIFESYLNEFTQNRHLPNAFDNLTLAKGDYLDNVPKKETNGQYYYFLARFLEEQWWMSSKTGKMTSVNLLVGAAHAVEKSMTLYQQARSGYQASHKYPFWLLCHQAILFKLLKHQQATEVADKYRKQILEEVSKFPLKKSVQMYTATYYLLSDDEKGLKKFLLQLDQKIDSGVFADRAKLKGEMSEVDNSTFHHAELLFIDNELKRDRYIKLLNEWFKKKVSS